MKLKDMNFPQEKVDENLEKQSQNKRTKICKIHLTAEELIHLRDNCPNDLMNLIIKHEWMKLIYDADWEHNERLQIVRLFFNRPANVKKKEQIKTGQTENGQIKLL